MAFGQFGYTLNNAAILFSRAVIFSTRIVILCGSPCIAFFTREAAAGQRALGGHCDIILSAQAEELPFIVAHN